MEPTKILTISIKNPNKIEVVEDWLFGTKEDIALLRPFKIFPPKIYSFKTPEGVTAYLEAVLQENHHYVLNVKSRSVDNAGNTVGYMATLTVDGIEFNAHSNGLIVSAISGHSELIVSSELPRNNLKLYEAFLPILNLEKQRLALEKALLAAGLGKESLTITEASRGSKGFKIECYNSFDGVYHNFEMFFYLETNKLEFIHLFHHEGETYYSGNEPYTLANIQAEIKRLECLAASYKMIEEKINSIQIIL